MLDYWHQADDFVNVLDTASMRIRVNKRDTSKQTESALTVHKSLIFKILREIIDCPGKNCKFSDNQAGGVTRRNRAPVPASARQLTVVQPCDSHSLPPGLSVPCRCRNRPIQDVRNRIRTPTPPASSQSFLSA